FTAWRRVMSGALGWGNRRICAVKSTGLPAGDTNLAHAFLPGWPFKVGILERSLLPDVGEGLTGSPVVGPVNCPSGPGSGSVAPHIGLIPDAGPAYILTNDATSC